jgi:hypothetical protein
MNQTTGANKVGDNLGITRQLSTDPGSFENLFISSVILKAGMPTGFKTPQVLDKTSENRAMHRFWLPLSTTTYLN